MACAWCWPRSSLSSCSRSNETYRTLATIPVLAAIAYWLVVRRRQLEDVDIEEVVIDQPALASGRASAPLGTMD